MTSSEDFAYGDAEPTEYQRGFIAGIEADERMPAFVLRLEALKAAIKSESIDGGSGPVERSERILKAATMFERYLETGK